LPDTRLDAALVCNGDLPDADGPPGPWRALLPEAAAPPRGLLVLCNPFHCDVPALLAGLDYGFPGMPKVGGIASGSRHPDGTALFFGRSTHRHGAIVVGLGGNVRLDAVVCQGSRPIGKAGRVTKAESNRLVAVDDKPVRDYVEEQLATLPWLDIERATDSLLLGISHDSFASDPPAPGEYLVRNILGMAQGGELVVAVRLAIGRHVQLHLRDEAATAADLRALLQRAEPQHAAAGLLFRCLGREGTDHTTFDAVAPGVPLAGFDCGGEIGTVGATTALHTYTAAFALLRPHSAPASERNERP
jgi:small ligand-binding sensory domain FIST